MWSDKETYQDCLGYTAYVQVLANVCTHKDLAPLTLGIFGAWGSGKTSLMEMLRRHIDANKGDKKRKTLWFNAWMHEGSEEARTALIHALLRLLQEEVSVGGEIKQLWDKLKTGASVLKLGKALTKSVITMSPDIDGFVDAFDKESDRITETMETFESDLRRLMELVKVDRIVVFIDDLDRCSSAKVIETFETIKLFLNTPTCTFVIGADADKIKHAVGEVYGIDDKQRQKDYLEKIVQIPFSIPAQDVRDIGCYIGMLVVGRHLNDTAWTKLSGNRRKFYDASDLKGSFTDWTDENQIAFGDGTTAVDQELEAILPYVDVLARGLRGNPRQIKRFLNILSLRRQLGEANKLDTKQDMLVKLAVLEYTWDGFFNDLVVNADTKTGKSELLGKIVTTKAGEATEKSEVLEKHLSKPGLVEFLTASPSIDGNTNLSPYLFLAQTSLGRSQAVGIAPVDESTKALVKTIEAADPIPSRAAAKRAAQDSALAGAVFRQIVADLPSAQDEASIVNMLGACETIGTAQPDLFKLVWKPLEKLGAASPAVALAASTLVAAAEKHGSPADASLKKKFKSGSRIADALSKPRSATNRRG